MKVEVINLKKHFGKTKAVDAISFSFSSGQVFGFVGPNGAGKTTTMRILATLDEPTDGDALIDGYSVIEQPERARRLIGFVPDTLPTHRDISVHEYLDFFARTYGLRGAKRDEMVENIEDFTNLSGIREKQLIVLSKGMKQRVSLARALVHDPQVLIMDEPAAGLDPRARVELRELISILAEQGKAILISSHILTELSEICDGAVIIERGKILRAGTLDQIVAEERPYRTIVVRSLSDPSGLHQAALEMPHVEDARLALGQVEIDIAGDEEACSDLLHALIQRGFRILEFKIQSADLENLFMSITKGDVQ